MAFDFHRINDDFAVAPQLSADDMQAVAEAGFKSVIINRPDGEGGANQPASDDVMNAAKIAGLQVVYQPVISGQMTVDNVETFAGLLQSMPQPILAYCRTGTRCANLYYAATEA
jgi:uncharacterized protein (TIGR01244 family)